LRHWIRLVLPIGLAAVFFFSVRARSQPAVLRPVSVQMHVHASMCEGPGSWRAANVHAKTIGLDVLWWSDHDWRMAYYTYNRAFGFEGLDLRPPVPTAEGRSLVFSNPIDFRTGPGGTVSADKRVLCH
jgi:hypothetical protein